MTELLSCPFCGGDVSFHKDEECPGCHLIQCGQCRAFFDFATGADPGNDCESVDALRAAIAPMWNTRAQLAAIQGGMGEAIEPCADLNHHERYRAGWNACLAQHQRITAAMAAEVATWRSSALMLEQANVGLAQLNGKLRAELAELRDRLDVMTQCADNYSRMFEESSEECDKLAGLLNLYRNEVVPDDLDERIDAALAEVNK